MTEVIQIYNDAKETKRTDEESQKNFQTYFARSDGEEVEMPYHTTLEEEEGFAIILTVRFHVMDKHVE